MTDLPTTNGLQLLQAATAFNARLSGEFASVHGVSVNEFLLMQHLREAPGGRLSRVQLAKRMHLSPSTITRMARPMEKIGLLDRGTHERDARLAFVILTATGRTRLEEAEVTFAKRCDALFADRWSEADHERLAELLQRLPVQ